MGRRILTLLIFLLAGAVVNVAVAWGVVFPLENHQIAFIPGGAVEIDPASFRWWTEHAPTSFAQSPDKVVARAPLTGASVVLAGRAEPYLGVVRLRTGWPMRSMEGAIWYLEQFGRPFFYQRAFRIRDPASTNLQIFPFSVLWSGFAVNTAFYTSILWLLIPGSFVLRRVIRKRRGRCPGCAYPMGEGTVCTECGKPLPGRVEAVS